MEKYIHEKKTLEKWLIWKIKPNQIGRRPLFIDILKISPWKKNPPLKSNYPLSTHTQKIITHEKIYPLQKNISLEKWFIWKIYPKQLGSRPLFIDILKISSWKIITHGKIYPWKKNLGKMIDLKNQTKSNWKKTSVYRHIKNFTMEKKSPIEK